MTTEESVKQQFAEEYIKRALKKIGRSKEKDLCRYLPAPAAAEGYMHHFTLKKIKRTNPDELRSLLQEFILDPATPATIDPKPRARRNKSLALNQSEFKLVLKLAQKSGDKNLLSKLGNKLSLPRIKRELIRSIKEERVEEELWYSYVQAVEAATNATSQL